MSTYISNLCLWIFGTTTATTLTIYIASITLLVLLNRLQHDAKQNEHKKKLLKHKLAPLPTPPSVPLIGHLHLMRDYQDNPWAGFNAIRGQYGDVVALKMGVHQMVLVSNSKLMEEVLIEKGNVFADRPNFPRHHIVFGGDKEHSLALCNWSQVHATRRKFCKRGVVPNKHSRRNVLLETVVSSSVANFIHNVDHCSARVNFLKHSNKDNSDVQYNQAQVTKRDILFLTGDVFMQFLCNERRPWTDESYAKFNQECDFIFWDINQCYLIDFMPYLTSLGVGFSYLRQLKQVTDSCRNYIDDNIFNPRRNKIMLRMKQPAEPANGAAPQNDTHDDLNNDNDDDYDYLDSITREQMSGTTSMTLEDYKVGFADMLAGHAAVANILTRMLGHLALNHEAQHLVAQEAERTNVARLGCHDDRPALPVAGAALQEALRLASSPIVPHVACRDTSIDHYHVPKGSAVLFNCYGINMSEQLWTKPDEFNIRRFLKIAQNASGETSYKLHVPKHFFPFSRGQRECLGSKMVESISIVAVSNICGRYKIAVNDERLAAHLLKPRGTVALDPQAECFKLILTPR